MLKTQEGTSRTSSSGQVVAETVSDVAFGLRVLVVAYPEEVISVWILLASQCKVAVSHFASSFVSPLSASRTMLSPLSIASPTAQTPSPLYNFASTMPNNSPATNLFQPKPVFNFQNTYGYPKATGSDSIFKVQSQTSGFRSKSPVPNASTNTQHFGEQPVNQWSWPATAAPSSMSSLNLQPHPLSPVPKLFPEHSSTQLADAGSSFAFQGHSPTHGFTQMLSTSGNRRVWN